MFQALGDIQMIGPEILFCDSNCLSLQSPLLGRIAIFNKSVGFIAQAIPFGLVAEGRGANG